jgi:hypothetical protein
MMQSKKWKGEKGRAPGDFMSQLHCNCCFTGHGETVRHSQRRLGRRGHSQGCPCVGVVLLLCCCCCACRSKFGHLEVLIANAGILGQMQVSRLDIT